MRFGTCPAARSIRARTVLAVMLAVLAGAAVLAFAGDGRADAAAVPSIAPAASHDRTSTGGGNCTGPVLARNIRVLSATPSSALNRLRELVAAASWTIADIRAISGATWQLSINEGRDCGGTMRWQTRSAVVPSANFPEAHPNPPRPPSCDQIHRSRQPVAAATRRVRVTNAGGFQAWQRQSNWRVNVTDECGNTHQEDFGWTACSYLNRPRSYEIHERAVRASDNRIAYRVTETFSISCAYGRSSQQYSASYWTYSLPSSY